MTRVAGWVTALLLVAGAALAGQPLTFRWPLPARATVTERVTKKGVTATLRYEASLTANGGGDTLALRLTKLELLDVAGANTRDPRLRKQLEAALKAASVLPTIVISREGDFLDVADVDRTIDRIIAGARLPAAERRSMAAMMKSPAMLATLKERSADFWNVWVGLWVGQALDPSRPVRLAQQMALPDGSTLDRPLILTHRGIDGPPGHVRLAFESSLDGGDERKAKTFLASVLQQFGGAAGRPLPPQLVERVAMRSSGEVITDPSTLRPVRAGLMRELVLKLAGEPPRTEVERHEYAFEWAAGR